MANTKYKSKRRNLTKARINKKRRAYTRKQYGGNLHKKVWCFWLGDTPMSEQREKCLQSIRDTIGVEVVLITDDSLNSYIKPEYPLHEAYQYLSGTHKCDYIRGYFMLHYGGGYTDIKLTSESWEKYFTMLENEPNLWAIGYKEIGEYGVAPAINNEALTAKMKENYTKLIGNCAYIFKPNTPFTKEWVAEVNTQLDKHLSELKVHPASNPRDKKGENGSLYPLHWTEILGSIFHPLAYKYSDHISTVLPPPQFTGYL